MATRFIAFRFSARFSWFVGDGSKLDAVNLVATGLLVLPGTPADLVAVNWTR
ncbi:MAG TPA: hypothetical protein VKY19_12115 [Ktedonosporobacter sp.]|nr:hypothetical protein [Ktedonosporobacter sp.]